MKRFLAILLVLLVGGAILGLVSLNGIVVRTVEAAGTSALGVPTTLDDADVGLMSAGARIHRLAVENPDGFGATPFLALEEAAFDLRASTLFDRTIVIPLVEIRGARLSIEQLGKRSNAQAILANLRPKSGGAEPGADEAGTTEDGKRFRIERIVLEQVGVDLSLDVLGEGAQATTASLTIPEVVLENIGTDEDGASLQEILGEVVQALLSATLEADGASILDGTLRAALEGGLADLEGRGQELLDASKEKAADALEQAREELDGQKEALEGAVDDAKEKAADGARGLLEGLGGAKKDGE